jgi:GNAT superfamily N-acetyltransferase
VHTWLASDAYWAKGREAAVTLRSVEGSLTFGVYSPDGEQVGYARAVTDLATFAWLCDVYIARDARGAGLGSWLVELVRDRLLSTGVTRILLATEDAHGMYAKAGFTPLADPDRWMELDTRSGAVPLPTGKEQSGE